MELFFKDQIANKEVTWDTLIRDLNGIEFFNPYCSSDDFYAVFKQIIASLLLGKSIILLDDDFSEEELVKLTGQSTFDNFERPLSESERIKLLSKKDMLEALTEVNDQWSMTLFTSGTTGLPKKVKHSFRSIARFVRKSESKQNDVWGFAYNPTHMAGIQVFFQALLNGNPIVRLFGLSKEDLFREIENYSITNISATPTFYRLLLPAEGVCESVLRLTSGGEKFDEKTIQQLKIAFPRAKITNVYASTEAGTLFASQGNDFVIKPEFEKLIKIENNELLIHRSLMGETEILQGEWYNTGDLVEVIEEAPVKFRFISRKNEMINVGGYKVNPSEVEEAIRDIRGTQDVRVFAKKNSVLGNVICCEVVKTDPRLEEVNIRAFLQGKLQEFKIPRIIKFVDKLSTTHTGKVKRN